MTDTDTPLDAADAALRAGAWHEAAVAYRGVLAVTAAPEACEGLSRAAWWLDDAQTTLQAMESAYRQYRDRGDDVGAARAAAALAYDSLLFGRGPAVSRGWLGRARDLLDLREETVEHGWLAVREAAAR